MVTLKRSGISSRNSIARNHGIHGFNAKSEKIAKKCQKPHMTTRFAIPLSLSSEPFISHEKASTIHGRATDFATQQCQDSLLLLPCEASKLNLWFLVIGWELVTPHMGSSAMTSQSCLGLNPVQSGMSGKLKGCSGAVTVILDTPTKESLCTVTAPHSRNSACWQFH